MKSILQIFISFGLLLLVVSCNQNPSNEPGANSVENDSVEVYSVKVQVLQPQEIPTELEYTANLQAFEEVHFAPASPGRIDEIYVEVGNRVSKGQLLFEMDKSQLQQALTQLENARSNFNRLDTLRKLGSISEQQYEQVKTQYELAKSNVEFLKENTRMVSPINGLVTGKYFEEGEVYSGAPTPSSGKPAVLSLMQIDPLKAMVNISQRFYPDVKEGMDAVVTSDIYPDKSFSGKIYRKHPTVNPGTRTFETEVSVNNPNELLRPGMFAKILIGLGEAEVIAVPSIAVLKQEGTNNRYVFIDDNGIAKKINVNIIKRYDDKLVIDSPEITEGTRLIVAGQAKLMNGYNIRVVE